MLSVTIEAGGDGVVVVPCGELEAETLQLLTRCLAAALDAGCTPVRVDMSGISFVDVAGYRAILRFAEHCRVGNVVVEWLRPSRSVQLAFRILGPPDGVIVDGAGVMQIPPDVAAWHSPASQAATAG